MLAALQQVPQAFVVQLMEEPSPELTLADVLLGSLGLVGLLVLLALVLGTLLAIALVRWHRRHPPESDHLPPVSPFVTRPNARTSSPAQ